MEKIKNDLMKVDQLPIITERLKAKSEEIKARTSEAKAMICTEDTVKAVKALRADLNKECRELEDQRKAIKETIMKPYNDFEAVYKELIVTPYREADADLKSKVDDVESGLKDLKAEDVMTYFYEYATAKNLAWLPFEVTGVTVTLSASAKSLKAECKAFVDMVSDDIGMIETQQYAAEILVEYKKTFRASEAIRIVIDRHLEIENAEIERKHIAEAKAAETKRVEPFADFLPPPVAEPAKAEEPQMSITFTVTDTRDRLIAIRDFLKNGGYKYV